MVRPADAPVVHIVDDDGAVRDSLAVLIRLLGPAVEAHACAEAFLARLPGRTCSCLVTDLHLTGMNGLQLLRRVRAEHRALPVILMTGRMRPEVAAEAAQAGAVSVIEKPFAPGDLLRLIEAAIGHGRAGAAGDPDGR